MDFLREIVSGKKKRFKDEEFNLDLTYITRRIIAMSFPACGFESAYRNNILDVSKFLREKHASNYLIFNLSGRNYDTSKFGNLVENHPWEDHHSPPIDTLFKVCSVIDKFLKQCVSNVIVVHCLAGKGRTGTVICCYLLYSGRFDNPKDVLNYYSQKRFGTDELGVTQPSQVRYIYYFYRIFKGDVIYPTIKLMEEVKLIGAPNFNGKNSCKPIVEIITVKDNKKVYTDKKNYLNQSSFSDEKFSGVNPEFVVKIDKTVPLFGDILVRLKNNGPVKNKLIARCAFNIAFVPENNTLKLNLNELDPDSTCKDPRFPQDFLVEIKFLDFCKCNKEVKRCQVCENLLKNELGFWQEIKDVLNKYQPLDSFKSKILLFGDPDFDDVEEVLLGDESESAEILRHDSFDFEDEACLYKYIDQKEEHKKKKNRLRKSSSANNLGESSLFHKEKEKSKAIRKKIGQ